MHVFRQTAIDRFAVAKVALHDQKHVFHLASDQRFTVFDHPFPVDSSEFLVCFQARWPFIDTEIDLRKVFVVLDRLQLLNAEVARIAVNNGVIRTYEFWGLGRIVNVCGRDGDRVDVTRASVNASVNFHTEMPLVALFRLVHFRVAITGLSAFRSFQD